MKDGTQEKLKNNWELICRIELLNHRIVESCYDFTSTNFI